MGLPTKLPAAILWGPRKEGEQHFHVRGRMPVFIYEPAAPFEQVLHECA